MTGAATGANLYKEFNAMDIIQGVIDKVASRKLGVAAAATGAVEITLPLGYCGYWEVWLINQYDIDLSWGSNPKNRCTDRHLAAAKDISLGLSFYGYQRVNMCAASSGLADIKRR
jgi:hypothetical protein